MRMLALAAAGLSVALGGCATADAPHLVAGAQYVRTGKADPDPSMRELGPIEATNGSGCGGFGAQGTYEGALNELKNRGAAMRADYIQIFTITEPHRAAGCYVDEFVIRGMAFKASVRPHAAAPAAAADRPVPEGAPSGAAGCDPPCSPGFACRGAVCKPVCNPPCEAGETCTRKRVCEPSPPG